LNFLFINSWQSVPHSVDRKPVRVLTQCCPAVLKISTWWLIRVMIISYINLSNYFSQQLLLSSNGISLYTIQHGRPPNIRILTFVGALLGWIPSFWLKAVFWIPGIRAAGNITSNYRKSLTGYLWYSSVHCKSTALLGQNLCTWCTQHWDFKLSLFRHAAVLFTYFPHLINKR
jgi:hypothetical protein